MADSNTTEKICGICTNAPSKYCCPRCDILYCSLDCYKSEPHSDCSETFYRDCITNELASYETDDDSKRKMLEILKRMQDNDEGSIPEEFDDEIDSDDDNDVELHERLLGLDLNDADSVWNALTDDERNEFKAMLNQGDVTSVIPHWEPWWMQRNEKKLVENVGQDNEVLAECPDLITAPDISSLTKAQPSPTIKYNITNVLSSYAFVMRYFNGEIDPIEAVVYLLNICDNLDLNTNFEEPALAVESVIQKCLQSDLVQTDRNSMNVMRYDTFHLLQGPNDENKNYYCQSALSHLHTILTEAKTRSKLAKNQNTKDKLSKNEDNVSKSKDKFSKNEDNFTKSKDKSSENDDSVSECKDKFSKNEDNLSKGKDNVKNKDSFSKNFPDHKVENLPSLDLNKLKKCIKKIEFYLSYVQSCGMEFEFE